MASSRATAGQVPGRRGSSAVHQFRNVDPDRRVCRIITPCSERPGNSDCSSGPVYGSDDVRRNDLRQQLQDLSDQYTESDDSMKLLNRNIQRPDLWALHLHCVACDWRTSPEGPYRLRDVLWPPEKCPLCRSDVYLVIPDCPYCQQNAIVRRARRSSSGCGALRALFRVPRTVSQALWGGFTCPNCHRIYDKWGRRADDG